METVGAWTTSHPPPPASPPLHTPSPTRSRGAKLPRLEFGSQPLATVVTAVGGSNAHWPRLSAVNDYGG